MAKPHKADEIDDWSAVKDPPEPKLDHPTMTDMFAYLLEVEGHRDIDPYASNAMATSPGPNPFCGAGNTRRELCPSCAALRLYRHGKIEQED